MKNNRLMLSFIGLVAVFTFLIAGNMAFAADSTAPAGHNNRGLGGFGGRAPGVFGTVSAISGNTLTVTSKMRPFNRPGNGTNTNTADNTTAASVYSVDDSNATVMKNNATSTVADIAVGDTVMVQGTINGSSVTATMIRDGIPQMGNRPQGAKPQGNNPANIIQGNGEPVVGGNVTAINGSTLSITNKSNISYTVDTSSATIQKGRATSTVESIAIGDSVVVQGTVNGSAITASSVIDQAAKSSSTNNTNTNKGMMGGFFGAIGGFFHKMFGFF